MISTGPVQFVSIILGAGCETPGGRFNMIAVVTGRGQSTVVCRDLNKGVRK